jgi:hypothetical protein
MDLVSKFSYLLEICFNVLIESAELGYEGNKN